MSRLNIRPREDRTQDSKARVPCIFCGSHDSHVVSVRCRPSGTVWRRRECQNCHERYSSLEQTVLPHARATGDADEIDAQA